MCAIATVSLYGMSAEELKAADVSFGVVPGQSGHDIVAAQTVRTRAFEAPLIVSLFDVLGVSEDGPGPDYGRFHGTFESCLTGFDLRFITFSVGNEVRVLNIRSHPGSRQK